MVHHRMRLTTLTFSSSVVRLVRESEGSKKNTQYHNNKRMLRCGSNKLSQ